MNVDRFEQEVRWVDGLRRIAASPLELCESFPRIAARHDAWWRGEITGCPVLIAAKGRGLPAPRGRCVELMDDPQRWLDTRKQQLADLAPLADGLPHIRVDLGPAALGPMLGGRTEITPDTVWTHPHIDDDYTNAPTGLLCEDNLYWRQFQACLEALAADAAGRYLVMSPDIGGSADVLTNLRGPDLLGMDMLEQPQRAAEALAGMYPAWRQVFAKLYDVAVVEHGAGVISWLGLWSNHPYTVVNCDFSALIGPREFARVFLPEIDRVARSAGRAVFHLDGPDAVRHADALAELDSLDAIQFTPGAGTPSALAHAPMLRRLQQKGKSVVPCVPAGEVASIVDALLPERLAMIVEGPGEQVGEVVGQVEARYGGR